MDDDAAAEGVAVWERIHAAFVALGETPPPAPLFVVLGTEEQLLPVDPKQAMELIRNWHQTIVAGEAMPSGMAMGTPSDASPELIAGMARVVPAAFPLDATELGMPASWQRTSAWGMAMPADATIVAVSDLMIDEGLEKSDIGWGKRLLMAPVMPWIRGAIRDLFREVIVRQLVDASCSPRVLGRPCSPEQKIKLLEQLGLASQMQPKAPPPGMAEKLGEPTKR